MVIALVSGPVEVHFANVIKKWAIWRIFRGLPASYVTSYIICFVTVGGQSYRHVNRIVNSVLCVRTAD